MIGVVDDQGNGDAHPRRKACYRLNLSAFRVSEETHGGDLVSTWVAKPWVHAEAQTTS